VTSTSRRHGQGHTYKIDGNRVPGVTTLLKKVESGQGLIKWAAETAADCVVDEWDLLAEMKPSERRKYVAEARNRLLSKASARGTDVHSLAERISHGEEVTPPEELIGHVDSCIAFLDEWHAQPVLTEFPVFSRKWGYGGTPDALMDVDRPEGAAKSMVLDDADRWRVLIDWKTKQSGPWGTDALQLTGYKWAEYTTDADGNEVPWGWSEGRYDNGKPLAVCDETWIVWLRADGYDVHPMDTSERVYKAFLWAVALAKRLDESREWRLDAISAPRRGAKLEAV
jgi:hypothetical protein